MRPLPKFKRVSRDVRGQLRPLKVRKTVRALQLRDERIWRREMGRGGPE